jgi:hypothetical protein
MKIVSIFALIVLLFSLNACQKDAIAPAIEASSLQTPSSIDVQNIVTVPDVPDARQTLSLGTRNNIPDIKDTLMPTIDVLIACFGTPDVCLEAGLKVRRANSIKPGNRIGLLNTVNLEGNAINLKTIYNYIAPNGGGAVSMVGYNGKERRHPLNIEADGNYRIQMSPLSPTRNLDMFVYKLEVKNGQIDSTLVAFGTLPAGQTETVHITKKGYYTIIVDEKNAAGSDTDYLLAVSPHTLTKATSFIQNNSLVYKFDLVVGISIYTHTGWAFKKKINGVWTDVGTFAPTTSFIFGCSTCDYLVAPVFDLNTTPAVEIIEGTSTLIHP